MPPPPCPSRRRRTGVSSRRGKSGRSCFTGPLSRRAPRVLLGGPVGGGRDRVVARTAAPGMTTTQPASGEKAPAPRTVADQSVGGVFRTGRKEPALPPDQRRKRQLVGALGAPDAAFVEGHAGLGSIWLRSRGSPAAITLRLTGDQAAPAGLVPPVSSAPPRDRLGDSLHRRPEREQRRSVAGPKVLVRAEDHQIRKTYVGAEAAPLHT